MCHESVSAALKLAVPAFVSLHQQEWDEHFTPILASGDTGAAPLQGGLLVAHYSRGWFVYTGLAFFRQLPDGVPGAYRLFANLIALGKDK